MSIESMPAAEVVVDASRVHALLKEQHPDLSDLPLATVGHGWDNALFRLGDDLLVRLPRRRAAAPLIEHECRWLPELAPRLPITIPVPLRRGRPGLGFPWSWVVTSWTPGRTADESPPRDLAETARELGAFLAALHTVAPAEAPRNPHRGVPLSDRAAGVEERLTRAEHLVDTRALSAIWEACLHAPVWSGAPQWIHGDLHPANLVVTGGRLSAVIDFGDLTAGDPATDLAVAWMLLPSDARSIFRQAARDTTQPIDDHTWTRARGWALALGLAFLATSRDNAAMSAIGRATLEAILQEDATGLP